MKFKNPFKRKNYASPYYGKGNRALFTSPPMIPQQQEELPKSTQAPMQVIKRESAEPDWEQRRFELVKMLIAQDRRSVVLGKLKANNHQIAVNARKLADITVTELQNHPLNHERGEEEEY